MEIAPYDDQAHHLGLSAACGNLTAVFRPAVILRINAQCKVFNALVPEFKYQLCHISNSTEFIEIDDRLNGFTLCPMVAERDGVSVIILDLVFSAKPKTEQGSSCVTNARIATTAPYLYLRPDRSDQRTLARTTPWGNDRRISWFGIWQAMPDRFFPGFEKGLQG